MVSALIKQRGLFLLLIFILFVGCSLRPAKRHFLLAEKLWTEKNYEAAVVEFEKSAQADPSGPIGLQARYRAGITQYLFLEKYSEALRNLEEVIKLSSDQALVWDALRLTGEILFNKMERFSLAAKHYEKMAERAPSKTERAEFFYLSGKSHFLSGQFGAALEKFQKLTAHNPGFPEEWPSSWVEKALLDEGAVYFTSGERGPGGADYCAKAIEKYKELLVRFPSGALVPQAQFGVANCYEDQGKLQEALSLYESLLGTFPSKNVIRIKTARLKSRMNKKGGAVLK